MDLIVHDAPAPASVQDLGRPAARGAGVPVGGAMDALAMRVANLLVGNDDSAAGVECALAGPDVSFSQDVTVAVCGAAVEGVVGWRPIRLRKRQRLELRRITGGCRAYLAVAGGLDVPQMLGSRSTDLRGGFGGHLGRALRAGDRVPVGRPAVPAAPPGEGWRVAASIVPPYSPDATLHLIPESDALAAALFDRAFVVDRDSDRMGVRLRPVEDGGPPLASELSADLPSRTVIPGVVQLPPDGRPIVLAADAPTIGGYAVAGAVISVDLPVLAQLRPGDRVRFRSIGVAEARRRLQRRERGLAMLRAGLHHGRGGRR